MKTSAPSVQQRAQLHSKRQAFLSKIEKEMSDKYISFLKYEKVKREKVNALIVHYTYKADGLTKRQKAFKTLMADFRHKVLDIYKDDLKVQKCA